MPPLTDALGHLSRFHIQTAVDGSTDLQRFYRFAWAPIGNLGVDLLIVPLAPLLGVAAATRLVVLTIPLLTGVGLILVAGEWHGRATPFVGFALPLAYGYPFQFGFLNYCLSIALALIAFAAWLALGKAGRWRLRAALFVPIGLILWVCHVFGWAVLGVLVAAHEGARRLEAGDGPWRAAWGSLYAALPLAPPLVLMLAWRSQAGGDTGIWFNLSTKLSWLVAVVQDRWEGFDRASSALLAFVAIAGGIERRVGYARSPLLVVLALLAVYLCLPFVLFGSAYADMRLAPLLFAVALIALRTPADRRWANGIAVAALAFFCARTAATTVSFARYDSAYREQLGAVAHIPRGARVLVFAGAACKSDWASPRMEHLGGLATVRRDAFVNDQWALRGAQLLSVDHPAAGRFQGDPSQIVRPIGCELPDESSRRDMLSHIPAGAFDYLWLINLPGAAGAGRRDLRLVWSIPTGALYRIEHPVPSDR